MTNKAKIEEKLNELGLSMGGYNSELERLSKKELEKVLDNMEYGSTDIQVKIRQKEYVVEVYHVDNEVDFGMLTTEQYENRYGRAVGEE
ncbi:hypothetical protein CVD28_01240 [Bacillus sp. M6-12]|uniref:hypothetical protein n=1 Tax=Bacillus sp. M6-12 TaxID=2054166 RepID=UPI000C75D181|nr:hypothetical protein [Bacillus sp. M6-12]PLS19058.1 hypothetical protein CVD28_01240 [Bacillus sp. M6-12]